MRRLILGTAGHIDHGKTALVRALTGTDTDRLPEEKRRGITIDLGFASLEVGDGLHIGIVDVPGHEAFVRNMLAGATGIDLALLVVAADEGIMPQTREHLAILEFLDVRALIVAVTKADLVEEDWLALVQEEIEAGLARGPWAGTPIQPVSVVDGRGLDALRELLAACAAGVSQRSDEDLFRLPIDRVFTVRGTGTVVTGTVWSGSVARDGQLRVLPGGFAARVRGIQSHGHDSERARAGERAAIAISGLNRDALARGDVLVDAAGWEPTPIVTVRARAAPDAPPLRHRQRVRFHLATAEIMGRIVLFDGPELGPGQEGWAQLRLENPAVTRTGDRFVLRSYSPVTTIAGGVIVEPHAARRKRLTPRARADLADVLSLSPPTALAAVARLGEWAGIQAPRLPVVTRLSPGTLATTSAGPAGATVGGTLFHSEILDEAARLILRVLDDHHASQPLSPGIHRDALRQALPARAPASLADAVLGRLTEERVIEAQGHTVRRAGWTATLTEEQTAAADAILTFAGEAGLAAPSAAELPPALAARPDHQDLIRHLVRNAHLVALPQDRFMEGGQFARAVTLVHQAFRRRDPLTVTDFRDMFGLSRKYLIPLLEQLDRAGVTVRSGDVRRPGGFGNPPSGTG